MSLDDEYEIYTDTEMYEDGEFYCKDTAREEYLSSFHKKDLLLIKSLRKEAAGSYCYVPDCLGNYPYGRAEDVYKAYIFLIDTDHFLNTFLDYYFGCFKNRMDKNVYKLFKSTFIKNI